MAQPLSRSNLSLLLPLHQACLAKLAAFRVGGAGAAAIAEVPLIQKEVGSLDTTPLIALEVSLGSRDQEEGLPVSSNRMDMDL